jgi:ABC-type lipoprotein release transport system permease subunit
MFDQMIIIFFSIIFITVVFSIINTLIMSIMERFHEIGVMKCIGTRPSHIFFMVIFESVNLGAVGLVSGVAAGAGMVIILGITGLDLSFMVEAMRSWKVGNVIYPSLGVVDIVKVAVVVFFTSIMAAIYPAIKAARIKPLEALHYV